MKTQDMMDSLLALGVKEGKLTCQELNDAFPAEFYPLDELERFLNLLDELGVKVIESGNLSRGSLGASFVRDKRVIPASIFLASSIL